MPITLTFTEGSLTRADAQKAGKFVTDLFLELHGLGGNKVMGPGVTTHINFLPLEQSLSNGEPFIGAWVETRTPNFALNTPELQKQFFSKSLDIIEELADGRIRRNDIYGSAIYAVDGTWILGGEPLTNTEIGDAISKG